MSAIACGQFDVLGDTCPGCGGWLSRVIVGGFVGPHGWRFCDLDCIDAYLDDQIIVHTEAHLGTRDLLCHCELCLAAGLPTPLMRQEYADYQAGLGGGDTTP